MEPLTVSDAQWKKGAEWENRILIRPEYRAALTEEIANRLRMRVEVALTCIYSNRGWFYQPYFIKLPRPAVACNLDTVVHELAHAYEWQIKRRDSHHDRNFKNSLSLLRFQLRPQYPAIFKAVKARIANEKAVFAQMVAKQTARAEKEAQRKRELALVRKSRSFRILSLRQRITRLETKRKRYETLLKTARRSLNALERLEAVSKTLVKTGE